jgi:4-diphosphocytidyl-2-C-methyl-D-erythritol kinase
MGEVGPVAVTRLAAPAKLTLSLRVLGRRPDGYHDLAAEMVSVDLADTLEIDPDGDGLVVEADDILAGSVDTGPDNLVRRALSAVSRRAGVRLVKRIPVGGGLGGGSTDAAAVLRWAGCADFEVAASLGADVPFCLAGGRAEVAGIGERVSSLPFEHREFVLLVPPFGVDTGAVYAAWDALGVIGGGPNELTGAALDVRPDLAHWRECLADATGRTPLLAGSGSTWFVEGSRAELGVGGLDRLGPGRERGRLLDVRTVPAGWSWPGGGHGPEVG